MRTPISVLFPLIWLPCIPITTLLTTNPLSIFSLPPALALKMSTLCYELSVRPILCTISSLGCSRPNRPHDIGAPSALSRITTEFQSFSTLDRHHRYEKKTLKPLKREVFSGQIEERSHPNKGKAEATTKRSNNNNAASTTTRTKNCSRYEHSYFYPILCYSVVILLWAI